jgi:hypothetical protein
MRGALFVILALLMLLASPAPMAGFSEGINQENISPGMAIGYPMAGPGGFQVMPSGPIFRHIAIAENIQISSWPLGIMPPFQAMFRGPTTING